MMPQSLPTGAGCHGNSKVAHKRQFISSFFSPRLTSCFAGGAIFTRRYIRRATLVLNTMCLVFLLFITLHPLDCDGSRMCRTSRDAAVQLHTLDVRLFNMVVEL